MAFFDDRRNNARLSGRIRSAVADRTSAGRTVSDFAVHYTTARTLI